MDFTKEIYISTSSASVELNLNSIASSSVTTSIGPRSGYKVMAASVGASSAVGYTDKRAVDDGLDVGDAYFQGRQVDISCAVFGSNLADFHSKLQALADLMRINPRYYDSSYGFRELKFSQATIDTTNYTSGTAALRMIVRPMAIPSIVYDQSDSIDQSVSTTSSRGFSSTLTLSFLAKEPYRYRQDQRAISISAASVSASSTTTSLPNIGSVPLAPVVEIIHPSTTTAALTIGSITIVLDSKTVKLNNLDFSAKTATDEVRWFVDFDAHAVYRGVRTTSGGPYVQTLRQDVIDSVYYRFGVITPPADGASTMTVSWTGSYKPDTITAKYYEAYY
jgi:hypothetical protein